MPLQKIPAYGAQGTLPSEADSRRAGWASISAIDNTTRKLMSDGERPLRVGFFFSLGHSAVVFAYLRCCSRSA